MSIKYSYFPQTQLINKDGWAIKSFIFYFFINKKKVCLLKTIYNLSFLCHVFVRQNVHEVHIIKNSLWLCKAALTYVKTDQKLESVQAGPADCVCGGQKCGSQPSDKAIQLNTKQQMKFKPQHLDSLI